jgi:hypothetical protein
MRAMLPALLVFGLEYKAKHDRMIERDLHRGTGTGRQARSTNLDFPAYGLIGMTAESDKWTGPE